MLIGAALVGGGILMLGILRWRRAAPLCRTVTHIHWNESRDVFHACQGDPVPEPGETVRAVIEAYHRW